MHKEIGEFKPDLLILDIYLAGLDGREICKNLRQHPETNNFPILLTSTVPAFWLSINLT
ncbi:response regulator [Ginsengibacter hankyongi]|uniref:Response regulator n=1 Tax=Ginsengibacter hankyongi TaxID=2607284 RepID=A0A5J5IK30_9BACT|nr:response regulator [Ginsengibacter hankyongi]